MTVDPVEIRRLIRIATARTGTPVNDDDLTQEASLRALRAFRRVGHVTHPRAFLMKIVSDTVRDHWRRRRPLEDIGTVDQFSIAVRPNFEDDIDRQRRAATLQAAVATLEASKRRLLQLFYEDQLSLAEIARREGRSLSAIKMQLVRTRQELARIVGAGVDKKSR